MRKRLGRARKNAITRGAYVGRAPAGYQKDEEGRLVPNEHADAVRAAFEARARGASWLHVAGILTKAGVSTSREQLNARHEQREVNGSRWSIKSVQTALRNEAYVGVARSGPYRNETAHEPLVSRSLFRKVAERCEAPVARGGEGALLAGVLRCANCGHRLTADYSMRPNGKRYDFYRCKNRGVCDSPTTISASMVEPYLIEQGVAKVATVSDKIQHVEDAKYEARLAAVEAEVAECERLIEAGEVSPSAGGKMLTRAERDRDAVLAEQPAKRSETFAYWTSTTQDEARAILSGVEPPPGDKRQLTGVLSLPERRRLLRELFGDVRVEVHRGKGPVDTRVTLGSV